MSTQASHLFLAFRRTNDRTSLKYCFGQVLHGYPKIEIVKCAEYLPADLVIMGSRGRRGVKRIVLGSVSHPVLMASNCSVRGNCF
jgi:hypothetical protein